MDFLSELNARFHTNPEAEMVEYRGRSVTRGQMAHFADAILALIDQAGLPPSCFAAVIVRNRPLIAATLIGLITRLRPLRTIYCFQSVEAMIEDVTGFGLVVADRQDWTPELVEAVRAQGGAGICLDLEAAQPVSFVPGLEQITMPAPRACEGEALLEMLSSGTTGRPKPVCFPYRLLERAAESSSKGRAMQGIAPDIFIWPFGGIGGICSLTANVYLGRHMTLMDKFNVQEWLAAVKKRRPHYVTATTTVLRMIDDAGIPPEDLASIKHYWGGSMHLPADFQEAFEQRYSADIIWALGATEFCGTILAWTPDLKREFGVTKRGSVGKPFSDTQVRVVDPETGEPLPAGAVGLIEALVPAVSPDWIRTTDLAEVDEDGFFFHRGRADGAIVRGGFKIIPEKLAEAIASHPAVLEAAVVGVDDDRLGQVPVAYVELRKGAQATEEELMHHAASHLAKTQMPLRIFALDALPRTASTKAALGILRERARADIGKVTG